MVRYDALLDQSEQLNLESLEKLYKGSLIPAVM